ncbi:MAG: hypothetical protein M1476_03230 [Candidatus Thermoplasmatota archaeon]|nr:hypothetical protein [Candidatus Thermoplasmatota archaeon]
MSESKVLKVLEKYRVKNASVPIIVEGKNDLQCLREIGFPGEIIIINSGNGLVSFSEKLSQIHREVILLTDFDRKGVELKNSLRAYMHGSGCTVDTYLWEIIRRYVPVRTVEELPFAVRRIEDINK